MKTLTPVLGLGLFLVSGLVMPLSAQSKPLFESSPTPERSLPNTSTPSPRRMAVYRDCLDAHANANDADFKQVNKFCACVADQSIQGSTGTLSDCATASKGNDTMGVIGEVAPSVITGVMEGLSSRSSRNSGILGGGGLLGGGLLGGLGDLLGGGGGFSIRDLLKNRL
ncbi:hypothetical protein [Altericista sp. CCNU0014]|uniref:hypothetical protein n=1 Tax=Altericista sp. CCNU0014 TaxID=3082949 RepID=UPI00384EB295